MSSRILFCAVVSPIGRSSAKLRRSPLTEYERAGKVTLRPDPPPRRSHTAKPTSFNPVSGPSSPKCSSASASLPAGLPESFGVILIVMMLLPAARTGQLVSRRRRRYQARCPIRGRAGVSVRHGERMELASLLRGSAVEEAEGWVKMTPRVAGETDDASVSLAEDHHLCEGERFRMGDRHMRRAAADGGEAAPGAAVEVEPRRAAAADDLDVAPKHALRVPGAERLHRGFLGCEAASEVD